MEPSEPHRGSQEPSWSKGSLDPLDLKPPGTLWAPEEKEIYNGKKQTLVKIRSVYTPPPNPAKKNLLDHGKLKESRDSWNPLGSKNPLAFALDPSLYIYPIPLLTNLFTCSLSIHLFIQYGWLFCNYVPIHLSMESMHRMSLISLPKPSIRQVVGAACFFLKYLIMKLKWNSSVLSADQSIFYFNLLINYFLNQPPTLTLKNDAISSVHFKE